MPYVFHICLGFVALFLLPHSAEFILFSASITKSLQKIQLKIQFQNLRSVSMASNLQKLIRKSQPTRIIAALGTQTSKNLPTPYILHQPLDPNNKLHQHCDSNSNPVSTSNPSHFSQFYPSFPFGFCLPQIPSTGLIPFEVDVVEDDDSRKLWADSVKKKRKRKMNKHKYKKLRKSLRRQT